MKYVGKAFTPSFIPLLFSFKRSSRIEECGFVGAGLCLLRGVSCLARVQPSNCVKLNMVYGKRQLNLPWIEEAVKRMAEASELDGVRGVLDFNFEVPLNLGLSVATASVISALAAVHKALNLNLSPEIVGDIAHSVEIEYEIGCGSSLPQLVGGVTLLVNAAPPSRARYVKLAGPEDLKIVIGGPATAQVVFRKFSWDAMTMECEDLESKLPKLSFEEILELAKTFTVKMMCNFKGSSEVLIELGKLSPLAYGFSFDGKTVYAIVRSDDVVRFVDLLLDFFPCEGILVSEVDPIGTRVYM